MFVTATGDVFHALLKSVKLGYFKLTFLV